MMSLRIKKENIIPIILGKKKEEYRTPNQYYFSRFGSEFCEKTSTMTKAPQRIKFYVGNKKDSLYCIVEVLKIRNECFMKFIPEGMKQGDYALTIYLGKIIEHNYS